MDPSLENLKDLVTQTLEKKGVLAKIRAELRASVFLAIDEQGQKAGVEANFTRAGSLGIAELQKHPHGGLLYNLVREYLEWCDLDYTLKVFVPESNVSVGHMSRGALEDTLKLGSSGASSDSLPLLLRILDQFLAKDGEASGLGGAYGGRTEGMDAGSNPLGALPSLGSGVRRSPLGLSSLAPLTSSRADASSASGSTVGSARDGLSALASSKWDNGEEDDDGDLDDGPFSNKGRTDGAKNASGSSAFKASSISEDLYTTTYRGGQPYHASNKNEADRGASSEGSDVEEEFEEDFEIASEGGKSEASSKSSGSLKRKQEEQGRSAAPTKPTSTTPPAPASASSAPLSSATPAASLAKPGLSSLSSTDPRSLNSLLSNPLAPSASLRPGPLGPLPSLGHPGGSSGGLEPLRGIPPIAGRTPPPLTPSPAATAPSRAARPTSHLPSRNRMMARPPATRRRWSARHPHRTTRKRRRRTTRISITTMRTCAGRTRLRSRRTTRCWRPTTVAATRRKTRTCTTQPSPTRGMAQRPICRTTRAACLSVIGVGS
eukprot:jgi/Mesvir1/14335/Mv09744-RA.1